MTATVERPEKVADTSRAGGPVGLRITVMILLVLTLGMGAWIIFDYIQDSALTPSAEMSELIDDYTAAWNEYDSEAFLASTREGFTFTSNTSGTFDRDEQADAIGDLGVYSWQVSILDDPVAVGDGPWYHVSFPVEITSTLSDVTHGVTMLTILEVDDRLLVTAHVFNGR